MAPIERTFPRITFTNFDDAVLAAAEQNQERDLRRDHEVSVSADSYIREAITVLSRYGRNYEPEFSDHALIALAA